MPLLKAAVEGAVTGASRRMFQSLVVARSYNDALWLSMRELSALAVASCASCVVCEEVTVTDW